MNFSKGTVCRGAWGTAPQATRKIPATAISSKPGSVASTALGIRSGRFGVGRRSALTCKALEAVSEAERDANEKRKQEAGDEESSTDEWRWTLNWDDITDNIVVGSCPRSPQDLERIADEAKATAVLSLQCDLCLEALQIDWESIRDRAAEKGVVISRVPIRDFDHGDQTLMLPEAVRTLATLLALNNRVYVHCTAGINRATLTVLGYFTFVKGWELNTALKLIKEKRPQAHPYIDCWKSTKGRMLQGRTEEVVAMAKKLFSESRAKEQDAFGNWVNAENRLIQETFRRQLACNLSLVSSLTDLNAHNISSCILAEEMEKAQEEITDLRDELHKERESLRKTLIDLEHGNALIMSSQSDDEDDDIEVGSCYLAFQELARAQTEIDALKQGLRDIAETSANALAGDELKKMQPAVAKEAAAVLKGAVEAGTAAVGKSDEAGGKSLQGHGKISDKGSKPSDSKGEEPLSGSSVSLG